MARDRVGYLGFSGANISSPGGVMKKLLNQNVILLTCSICGISVRSPPLLFVLSKIVHQVYYS